MVIHILHCRHCQSQNVIRHGLDENGKQRYRCHDCGRTFRERPKSRAHTAQFRDRALSAYQERASMRGVCRIFGIGRNTLRDWLKKSQTAPAARAELGPGSAR